MITRILNHYSGTGLQHMGVDPSLPCEAVSQLPAELPCAGHPDQIPISDLHVNIESYCNGFGYSLYITLNHSQA
jgi:hypothetical protein